MINQGNNADANKSGNTRRLAIRVGKILLILLVILVVTVTIFVFAFNQYLASNESKIFENIPWLNDGRISFDEASISIYKDFPNATLELENVEIRDSLYDEHETPFLKVHKLSAALALDNVWDKEVKIEGIDLYQGGLRFFKDKNGYNNFKTLIHQLNKSNTEQAKRKFSINAKQLNIRLRAMKVDFDDAIKTTSIHGHINELRTTLYLDKKDIQAAIDMDLDVEELAFKKAKGSYVANSKVAGIFNVTFKDNLIQVKPFDLKVNEEKFLFSGDIFIDGNLSELIIESNNTNYNNTLTLLPENIQQKLALWNVDGTFATKATIKSTFKEGFHPLINIDFKLNNNEVVAINNTYREVTLDARFSNRIFDDERALTEGKNRFKFDVHDLKAKYQNFDVAVQNGKVTSTLPKEIMIDAVANISGNAKEISQYLNNDQFFFEYGKFDLALFIDGPLQATKDIILNNDAILKFKKFAVHYQPSDVSFPFESLYLKKKASDAQFKIVNSTMVKGNNIQLDGIFKNFPSLLYHLEDQVSSDINFNSEKIRWMDFLNLFGKDGTFHNDAQKADREKKKSMKQTILGIYNNFLPQLKVDIASLQYFDLIQLDNFKTGLHFEDEKTLVLDKTSFTYDNSSVDFSGKLDISDPHQTPFEFELKAKGLNMQRLLPALNYFNIKLLASMEGYPEAMSLHIKHKGILNDATGLIPNTSTGEIVFVDEKTNGIKGIITYQPDHSGKQKIKNNSYVNTQIELEGDPALFNNFFKTEQFFFSEGRFFVKFKYTGDIATVEQLVSEASADFRMTNSLIYYKATDVHFPLTDINIHLNNDVADYDFLLKSDELKQRIHFEGSIENPSELIIGNTGKSFKTIVNIDSPKLKWHQFIDVFVPEDRAPQKELNISTMKATIAGIFTKFSPTFKAKVDTFVFTNQLQVNNFYTGVSLNKNKELVLDQSGFNFLNGAVKMDATIDLSKDKKTPFSTKIETDKLNVAALLKSVDYLSLPSLQQIKKLSGNITMQLQLEGIMDEVNNTLDQKATNGIFDFNLQDVELVGLPTLDTIAAKVRQQERFHTLRFAPIENEMEIHGEDIVIPLMEIQSNAANLFMEGVLSYGDATNIWVSIPLDNLKSRDVDAIPTKRGYGATRDKIFIEVTSDDNGDNKFKFHLSKKKFYKDRGMPEQYKVDKQSYKRVRKELKRLRKKE